MLAVLFGVLSASLRLEVSSMPSYAHWWGDDLQSRTCTNALGIYSELALAGGREIEKRNETSRASRRVVWFSKTALQANTIFVPVGDRPQILKSTWRAMPVGRTSSRRSSRGCVPSIGKRERYAPQPFSPEPAARGGRGRGRGKSATTTSNEDINQVRDDGAETQLSEGPSPFPPRRK